MRMRFTSAPTNIPSCTEAPIILAVKPATRINKKISMMPPADQRCLSVPYLHCLRPSCKTAVLTTSSSAHSPMHSFADFEPVEDWQHTTYACETSTGIHTEECNRSHCPELAERELQSKCEQQQLHSNLGQRFHLHELLLVAIRAY